MKPPWSFTDPEGRVHVVGPIDLPSVLQALRYRAEQLGGTAPTELTPADVEQAWMRLDERGENLVPSSPSCADAVMVTRLRNRTPDTDPR